MKKTIFFWIFLWLNNSIKAEIIPQTSSDPQNLTARATSSFDLERWKNLMSLIDNEIKTIKNNKYSGAELKHRLFELYSEKIRLIKEKENLNLLKADIHLIQRNGKESFFKGSTEQYKTAQAFAMSIISQYPNYQKIAEIYYALAINSLEFGTSADTEKFLKMSILQPKISNKTLHNSKTALAEYLYNNKKYNEAVSYYNDVLKNTDDEWYGKHLYNASWCHLKERNFKKGLELIKLSYETTKNKKYVSMKEQIFSAIGIFFVQANETYAGIDFFETNSSPSSTNLITLAQSSMNKNNFLITDDVLKAALKDTKKRNDHNLEMKVRLAQLDIYRENKKDDLFYETANDILVLHKKHSLDKDDLFQAQNKIKEVAGYMQINLIKDKTKDPVLYSKDEYSKTMRFFDILASLDKPSKNLYRYYQGETALSVQNYHIALNYYVRSIMNAKITKDKTETTRKALEAMLLIIERAKLSKAQENEYKIFAFKNFILLYPQSDKSQAIYQKIFNKYYELKKLKKAVNVLLAYIHYYKSDEKIHREMLTQILEYYIKKKDTERLAFWIGKIEKGYLSFSSEHIQKSIAILGTLLFDKYQSLEKQGFFKDALMGYEAIYDSKQYPNRTRAEAAYAFSALSLELNKSKQSYKWLMKSLDLYEDKDLIKVTTNLLALAKGYRLLQSIPFSSDLSQIVMTKFCKDQLQHKNDFYQIINENALLTNQPIDDIIKIQTKYSHCQLSEKTLTKTQIENMDKLIITDRLKDTISYQRAFPENKLLSQKMEKFAKYKFFQNPIDTRINIFSLSDTTDLSIVIKHFDVITDFIKKLNNIKFTFKHDEKFNEELFNSELEQHFAIIQDLTREVATLSKNSNPQEIFLLQSHLGKPYLNLADAINAFVPTGVDNRYAEGFKDGMRQITESLLAKSSQIDDEKRSFLEKNNYFFEVQKNDIVDLEKKSLTEQELHFHSANLFSNTLDIATANSTSNNRTVAGQ